MKVKSHSPRENHPLWPVSSAATTIPSITHRGDSFSPPGHPQTPLSAQTHTRFLSQGGRAGYAITAKKRARSSRESRVNPCAILGSHPLGLSPKATPPLYSLVLITGTHRACNASTSVLTDGRTSPLLHPARGLRTRIPYTDSSPFCTYLFFILLIFFIILIPEGVFFFLNSQGKRKKKRDDEKRKRQKGGKEKKKKPAASRRDAAPLR